MSTTIYVLSRNKKNIRIFCLKIFIILVVKFSIYLNRHVFVMNFASTHMADTLKVQSILSF